MGWSKEMPSVLVPQGSLAHMHSAESLLSSKVRDGLLRLAVGVDLARDPWISFRQPFVYMTVLEQHSKN